MRDLFQPVLAPADELAMLRGEIRRLRDRETELRTYFLNTPDAVLQGHGHRVSVIEREQRRLVADRLPDEIRGDPAYWRQNIVRTVKLVESPAPPPPPEEEAFDLIEPFD